MVQAKAKAPIGRKVTHKRTPTLTERPAGIATSGTPTDVATAEQEAHNKLVDSIMGKYADVNWTSEDAIREKQEDLKREGRLF